MITTREGQPSPAVALKPRTHPQPLQLKQMELTCYDWLRIRRALNAAVNDLKDESFDSNESSQYTRTYETVAKGLVAMYGVDFRNDGNTNTQVMKGKY